MKDTPIVDFSPLVLPSGSQLKDFLLPHKSEIIFVLKAIIKDKMPVMAYYGKQMQFFDTTLLEANSKDNRLQILASGHKETDKKIQENQSFMCVSYHFNVKVQFIVENYRLATTSSQSVFKSELPTKMYKLQRREYFRLSLEYGFPVFCSIPIKNIKRVEFSVYDLSLGGLSLVLPDKYANTFEKDEIIKACTISLPGMGTMIVDMQMRGSFTTINPDNSILRRLGCQFVNIHPLMEDVLQRFITVVERNRLAREASRNQTIKT